ncbi:hypothetical protein sos41_06510 [Alphaproteobacteria bacterium SO-S41]|nr:hypothetical protein sos41_06510 [Alphaproteobacteria bacterium SO-S41]
MGGFGSGRTGGSPSIERTDSIQLDVNVVAGIMRKHPGATWRWTFRRDGDELGWLTFSTNSPADPYCRLAFLRFNIAHFSRPTGEQSQTVRMVSAPCRFGGVRWYFLCPSSGRRCAKLFLPNGALRFYSRASLRLAYDVTREGPMDRAHRRLARLYRKLGQRYQGPDWQWPFRPKGMRKRTFKRIEAGIEWGTEALNIAFEAGCARFLKRDPTLADRLK